jgi:hypothetical protein
VPTHTMKDALVTRLLAAWGRKVWKSGCIESEFADPAQILMALCLPSAVES